MQFGFMSLPRRTPGRPERSEESRCSVGSKQSFEILRRGAGCHSLRMTCNKILHTHPNIFPREAICRTENFLPGRMYGSWYEYL